MNSLKDKIVFITGASSGFGAACAKYFARAGANLLLCARRLDLLNDLATELKNEYGINIHTFKLDVRQSAEVKEALQMLPDQWKTVDILVNNAGLAAGLETVQEGNTEDWDVMIDTNVKGLLYVTREILPQMIKRNSGHIVNIGSTAGHEVYPKGVVYATTKHAVNALTKGLRMDLFGTKIRVSTVDPGAAETNFSNVRFKGDTKRAAAVYEGMEALTADDIADAVLYCVTRPPHVDISEMIIMPTDQASIMMVSRKETKK